MATNTLFSGVERRPLATIALVGLCCAVVYLTGVLVVPSRAGRVINGDAIQYFAYLQSAVVDGDLDFTNDYQRLYLNSDPQTNVWLRSRTPAGRPPNMMSVGPAILWSPFYLAARAVLGAPEPGSRAEAALQASVGLAGVFYATLGAWFTFLACARLFSRRAAVWATLVVWLAGPAVYYSFVSPAYSHATSMCAAAAFVYAWLATRSGSGSRQALLFGGRKALLPRSRQALLLGALGGLVALVRWQDAVLLLLPAGDILFSVWRRERRPATAVLHLALVGIAAIATFTPQLLAWNAIYGTPLLMPQGAGFMRWTEPAVLSVLFSLRHGLFSWTPALLVAACGLPLLVRRGQRVGDQVGGQVGGQVRGQAGGQVGGQVGRQAGCQVGWLVVLVVALAVYVNASAMDWWAGAAFGARRFVSLGVLFALGMAALMDAPAASSRPRLVAWLSVAAIVYNLLFVLQYQLFMRGLQDLAPYPETVRQVFFDRLWLPVQLLARWLSG